MIKYELYDDSNGITELLGKFSSYNELRVYANRYINDTDGDCDLWYCKVVEGQNVGRMIKYWYH